MKLTKSIFSKVARVGGTTAFCLGLAVTLALMLGVATVALAAPGDPFKLSRTNAIDSISSLVGGVNGAMLRIDNNGNAANSTALDLRVEPGRPPLRVDSDAKVNNLNADKLDGEDASAFQDGYERTVVVGPEGTEAENGAALLDALAGITAASADKPYLLKIEPGVYDLGPNSLTMKPFVDIEGSGELATRITRAGGGGGGFNGTVVGADNAELRFLTAENTGGAYVTTAIHNDNASPRLTKVTATATASGGFRSLGVHNHGDSSPTMTDVTVTASEGEGQAYGVLNSISASPTMTNVRATASGADRANIAVVNDVDSSPVMTDVIATVEGGPVNSVNDAVFNSYSSPTMTNVTATASGGRENTGVRNVNGSSPTMRRVTAAASGGLSSYGIYNLGGAPTIQDGVIKAGGALNNYGVYNRGASTVILGSAIGTGTSGSGFGVYSVSGGTVEVDSSRVTGSSQSISNVSGTTVRVGASMLEGSVSNQGALRCVASYNGSYDPLSAACTP